MTPNPNVSLRAMKRVVKVDQYAQPTYAVVAEGIPARLTTRQRTERDGTGDFRAVDGDMVMDAAAPAPRAGDILVLEDGREFEVASLAESQDVAGVVLFRTCSVQRRK